MEAYGIVLAKNDETEAKIVTKETYDWIVSTDHGDTGGKSGWNDLTCPPNVKKRIWDSHPNKADYGTFEEFELRVTTGSLHNDRARHAAGMLAGDEELTYSNMFEFVSALNQHEIHIVETFYGYIYFYPTSPRFRY